MRLLRSLALLALAASAPLFAAEPTASLRNTGDAAHLFGYMPKAGMAAQFDAGYQKHLAWHRTHADPLVWYGWTVTHGPRMGMFIDGTFGAPFAAFDARVAPADDAKDAARTFLPYGEATYRATYRLRRELGTGTPLEEWKPTSQLQAVSYRVKVGKAAQFEQIVLRMRKLIEEQGGQGVHTWYEGVGGTTTPEYLLLIARDGWAGYARSPGDLERVLMTVDDATIRRELLAAYAASVDGVTSEIWRYRSEMSLIPGG